MTKTVDIHIFSPGKQTSSQGVTREFTKKDLKQVADSYIPERHEAPILVGHEMTDKTPSWGWVKKVKMKGDRLYAEVEFSPLMDEYIENGLYKKVSASFYSPESKINPEPGQWSLRHVAMLGAQPPAVKGLSGFAYSELSEGEGVLDFAVEMKLTPDQVFDKDLGPTLKEDTAPLEFLKTKLDEARQEMATENKKSEELEAQAESQQPEVAAQGEEFAEKDGKKKAPAGKQGAEEAEEEVSEDENVDMASSCGKKKNYKEGDDSADHAGSCDSKKNYKEGDKDAVDHKSKKYKEGEHDDAKHSEEAPFSEVAVPAGLDVDEYREGFTQAVLAYKEAVLIGGDVEFSEDEDVSESFKSGVAAGLEFAECEFIKDGKATSCGNGPHDKKMVSTDEESEGAGPELGAKGPGTPDSGANECDDCGEYDEGVVVRGGMVKRGKDNIKSSEMDYDKGAEVQPSDIMYKEMEGKDLPEALKKNAAKKKAESGKMSMDQAMKEDDEQHKEVFEDLPNGDPESKDTSKGAKDEKDYKSKTKVKATKTLIHGEDGLTDRAPSTKMTQNDQAGRGEVGKAGEEGKTFRAKGGKTTGKEGTGTDEARAIKGSDDGDAIAGRNDIGRSSEQAEGRAKVGQAPQDEDDRGKALSLGGYPGSGSAVKKPQVRVMYVGKKGASKPAQANFSESEQFSELTSRLAELEAANARLVQEKAQAERAAHRSHLSEFAESLFDTGRLTPAVIDAEELVDYMEGLEYGTLEFAEGESAATKLMDLLAALPSQVSFAEVAPFNKEELPVETLDPHEQALRLAKEEGIDYAEALKKTLFTAE